MNRWGRFVTGVCVGYALTIVAWPRVRCGFCGRCVWAWAYRRHVFEHVAEHGRAMRDLVAAVQR